MKKRRLLFIICLSSLSTLLFSCNDTVQNNKLKVGVHSWPGGGPIYIGMEKGFFKEQGLDVSINKIENFDTKRAALISGQIDIDLANTMDQLLIYNENNFNAVVIGVTDESTGGDGLVVKDEIKSLEDLKGKTIAYAEASPSDFFMRYILKEANIPVDSLHLKPVADPQIAGNTIIAKQVDASVTYEPFLSQAAATPGVKILVSTKQYPTLIPGLIIVNGVKLGQDSTVYARFMTAWFKSVDYLYSNPDDAIKIISKGMGMEVKDVTAILANIKVQNKDGNKRLTDADAKEGLSNLIKNITAFWKASGYIKKDLDPSKMINANIVRTN